MRLIVVLVVVAVGLGLKVELPGKIFAGQIHYSRIPVEYWEHRILMIKSMGLNALSVYVMWNYHEIAKGVFDFESGNKNLTLFLSLAKKHEMYVLIRPGPYVCAEWDFGGLPPRLLGIEGLVIRANNSLFLNEVSTYFKQVSTIIKPYLATANGTIILLQIENEYGFWGKDKNYVEAIRTLWKNIGIKVDEYYVDIISNLNNSHWVGANIGINNAINQTQFDIARTIEKKGLLFGGEIYSGWLTHWGEEWQGKTTDKMLKQYQFLLGYNHSFSMYMVHGGTNFGLTAGGNAYANQTYNYRGHITSYDYDAPINEQGSPTPKFFAVKQLIQKYATWDIPHVPDPLPIIQIPSFKPEIYAYLFDALPQPTLTNANKLPTFQSAQLKMYNQGMVLYETILPPKIYYIKIVVHDFAMVYLNQQLIYTLNRSESSTYNLTVECTRVSNNLRILVEAMGHINFDHPMVEDRKGIISITDEAKTNFLWKLYKIPVDKKVINHQGYITRHQQDISTTLSSYSPIVFRSQVTLDDAGDTYLNMALYQKGYVWVNGNNLGRYWNIGPQQKLFCPGVWLRKGRNQIVVLDLLALESATITGEKSRL